MDIYTYPKNMECLWLIKSKTEQCYIDNDVLKNKGANNGIYQFKGTISMLLEM